MIDLSGHIPLRESRNYKIFQHPEIEGALLKVRADEPVRNHAIPRYAAWRYGNLRQWNREANEYLAALNRGCPEIERLARFMGYAPTSQGPALVVEKLTGPDGGLAPTLQSEKIAAAKNREARQRLHDEFMELMDDLKQGQIIVGDMGFENIVRAQERGGKLVIIDGLGERVMFPLVLFSKMAFDKSIERRRARMSKGFNLGTN
ncbi:PhoP regulatory network protein YrbL [Ruegeria denitrificans]|uniref:PhoP regulatory network protein YrbL n=1 Tax=Ruegeria denitrificans TaxID=1715692 RepID=A0A0P1IHE5_9RHOB|nr:YrbL family protein [Ruegeria denitrificans]CUJ93279.1 PhoP regulatory network protein YrbL [Ruegeria denitrificans]